MKAIAPAIMNFHFMFSRISDYGWGIFLKPANGED
jgi:hypothetical protein